MRCQLPAPWAAACHAEKSAILAAINIEGLPTIHHRPNRGDRVSAPVRGFVPREGFEFFAHLSIRSSKDDDSISGLGADRADLLTIRHRTRSKDTNVSTFIGEGNPRAAKRGHRNSTHDDCAGDSDQLHLHPQGSTPSRPTGRASAAVKGTAECAEAEEVEAEQYILS